MFPEDFLRSHGAEMIATGEQTIRSAGAQRGFGALLVLMVRLLFDMAARLPAEHGSELMSDVRYGLRFMLGSKGMVAAVSLSTGLAIALAVMSYNEISIVTRNVPGIGKPETLLTISAPISYSDFIAYSGPNSPFRSAAAYMAPVAVSVERNGQIQRVWSHIVTPDYFAVLESPAPRAGIVVSEGFARNHFGDARQAPGQTLRINAQPVIVAGVAVKDFLGAAPLSSAAEIWIPTDTDPQIAPELAREHLHNPARREFRLIGRLKSGIDPAAAELQLDALAKKLEVERGETSSSIDPSRRITVLPGGQLFPVRKSDLLGMMALPAVFEGLVLFIACANAAILLLAKAVARQREITIRIALGASRRRMIKQLLTESLMLGIPGGLVGLALAFLLNLQTQKTILNTFPGYIRIDLSMGWQAAALAFGVSLASGILFGLAPALKATRVDLVRGLAASKGWFLSGYRWCSSRNLLVLLEVAGSVTLVIVTGIIALGFQRAVHVGNVGFEPRHVTAFSIDPLREGLSAEQTSAFLASLPARLRDIPGVQSAAIAEKSPLGDLALRTRSPRLGQPEPSAEAYVGAGETRRGIIVANEYAGPGYFDVLSVRPQRGRVFSASVTVQDPAEIVINEALAKQAWPEEDDAIGRQLRIGDRDYRVIGVVNDFRSTGLLAAARPVAFHPFGPEQIARPAAHGITVMVRENPGSNIKNRLEEEFRAIAPDLAIYDVSSLAGVVEQALAVVKIQTLSYAAIGLFGLILASVAIAGVTSYAGTQRNREIGIRVALGATRYQVLRLISREGALLVIAGTVLGQAVGLGLVRLLNAYLAGLYQITRTSSLDPIVLIAAPAFLATLTLCACFLPARRALRIDPARALRQE
jgi:predicted permease